MVEGNIQAVDAAYVEANACLDSMQPKDTNLDWHKYVQVFRNQDKPISRENPASDTLKALPKEEKRNRSNKTHPTWSVIALLIEMLVLPKRRANPVGFII